MQNLKFEAMFTFSPQTQPYFRLSLVSAQNNVCEPEPGNDFCDVGILSQSQFSSSSPRTTAPGIRCKEHSASFILSWNLIGQGETKAITSQKSFPGLGSQTLLFLAETSLRQPEIRLYSQASSHLVPECYSRRAQKWTHHFSKYSHQKYFGHRAHAWVQG